MWSTGSSMYDVIGDVVFDEEVVAVGKAGDVGQGPR